MAPVPFADVALGARARRIAEGAFAARFAADVRLVSPVAHETRRAIRLTDARLIHAGRRRANRAGGSVADAGRAALGASARFAEREASGCVAHAGAACGGARAIETVAAIQGRVATFAGGSLRPTRAAEAREPTLALVIVAARLAFGRRRLVTSRPFHFAAKLEIEKVARRGRPSGERNAPESAGERPTHVEIESRKLRSGTPKAPSREPFHRNPGGR